MARARSASRDCREMKWIGRSSKCRGTKGIAMSKRRRLVEFLIAAGTVGAMGHLLIVFSPQAGAYIYEAPDTGITQRTEELGG